MSLEPRQRNRLGITPLNWRPPDIDAYNGLPFRPYPKYERVTPRDLVQMLENNFHLLWVECVPCEVERKYQNLKTIAHDELWEREVDNGLGSRLLRQDSGERHAPVYVSPKQAKKIEPKQTTYYRRGQKRMPSFIPTERSGLTKDQILGKDHCDPFIQKFYPNQVFNR